VKPAVALALSVLLCVALFVQPAQAQQRLHYIAADEVMWNYVPQHRDLMSAQPLPPLGRRQLGWTFHKAIYREYTDRSFNRLASVSPGERYRGLLGPAIHAEVGDTVVVVFKNRTRMPVDIAPAGLRSSRNPGAVMPGNTRMFAWPISPNDGPVSKDESSTLYVYSSDVNQSADENAGLIGPLIVTRQGAARPDGSPNDVDQEVYTLFSAQRESMSPLLQANLHDHAVNPRGLRIARNPNAFVDDNTFPTINGYGFGNMPMPVVRAGKRVRWYMLSTSNAYDFHAPMWEDQTVLSQGNRVDSIGLTWRHSIVDMVPDDPGIKVLRCTVNVHLIGGMKARYRVSP
jgi:manganese oxidase